MTPEHLRLIAAILHGLATHLIVPYYDERGQNVGQCSICGARGEPTPDGTGLQWTHDETCVAALDAELQQSLQEGTHG